MKYIGSALFLAIILIGCGAKETPAKAEHEHDSMQGMAATMDEEKLIYYTCPMDEHKHIHSREAGNCPECNMELVAGVITTEENKEYYGCPMLIHSHVRHDEPGRCAECKMELKPMRLKKASS